MVRETQVGVSLSSVSLGYVGINLIQCVTPSSSTFHIRMERVKYSF